MNVWPLTAQPAVSFGGVGLAEIAERFDTPAYVLDEVHVRVRCREYAKAMAPHEVAYAAKALWRRAMARWIAEEDLSLDVCSEGELAVPAATDFPRSHPAARQRADAAGTVRRAGLRRRPDVVDSASEAGQLAALARQAGCQQKVLVRVTPGVDAHAHRR